MNTSAIAVGDIVRVDVLGRVCFAHVEGHTEGGLSIKPIGNRTFTWRTVTARQVREHYRLMGRPRSARGTRA